MTNFNSSDSTLLLIKVWNTLALVYLESIANTINTDLCSRFNSLFTYKKISPNDNHILTCCRQPGSSSGISTVRTTRASAPCCSWKHQVQPSAGKYQGWRRVRQGSCASCTRTQSGFHPPPRCQPACCWGSLPSKRL